MAQITWTNVGAGIEVVTDALNITAPISSTEPALIIPLSALAGAGLNDVDSIDSVEKVFLAICKNIRTFTKSSANLNDSFVEVDDPRLGNTERSNTAEVTGKFHTLDYSITFYKPDAVTTEFDPDNLDISTP